MGKHKLSTEETTGVLSGHNLCYDLTYHSNPRAPAKFNTCASLKRRIGGENEGGRENIDMFNWTIPWAYMVCENLPSQRYNFYQGVILLYQIYAPNKGNAA